MLQRLRIKNFKQFDDVTIELSQSVVFIGPNNSGKTTALQALTLWHFGLVMWLERRGENTAAAKRPGVTVNRKDIVSVPIAHALQLWRNLVAQPTGRGKERKSTEHVKIEITVTGVTDAGEAWELCMRFNYASGEALRCEPAWPNGAPASPHETASRILAHTNILLLPPMSGLASTEFFLQDGAINQLLGQGKSADVLRNLCYAVYLADRDGAAPGHGVPRVKAGGGWEAVTRRMNELFGVTLHEPEHIVARGEITLSYSQGVARQLDISAAGRGLQQTLMILAWFYKSKKGSVLLLDEPDAHLEFLRQQQIYSVLKEVSHERDCQIIAASHSEVLLNEAAGQEDNVIAFVGRPHLITSGTQTMKALKSIGFEHYVKAEQKGWVLYLEGSTDLEILRRFAGRLEHPAHRCLARPYVHYVQQPQKAYEHFFGLTEAKPDLVGLIVMDRLETTPQRPPDRLPLWTWQRREIENYLCMPEVLEAYAAALERLEQERESLGPLFGAPSPKHYVEVMRACVQANVTPAAMANRAASWWQNVKATDDFLNVVFADFAKKLGRSPLNKGSYYELIEHMRPDDFDAEISVMLDRIVEVASRAQPRGDGPLPIDVS